MKNIDIIKEGYKNFAEGKIEAVLANFDSEIVWEECQGFPYVEGDGIYRGHQEIVEGIFSNFPEYMDDFMIDIDELIECGDKVVMAGHYGGVWKATGKRFLANVTHVWTFKDGKVTHYFQAADTAAILNS